MIVYEYLRERKNYLSDFLMGISVTWFTIGISSPVLVKLPLFETIISSMINIICSSLFFELSVKSSKL